MKKTSIYLDAEVDRGLARVAAAQGITKAELIRRSLAHAVAEAPRSRLSVGVADAEGVDPDEIDEIIGRYLSDELDSMR